MRRQDKSRTGWAKTSRRFAVVAALAITASSLGTVVGAQTRTARDTTTAYGARLNAKGEPTNLNPKRINNRVNSRLETRLSLRVERYRTDSTNSPAAAFAVKSTDNTRVGTKTTLSPLSTSTLSDMSQAFEASSQTTSGPRRDDARAVR